MVERDMAAGGPIGAAATAAREGDGGRGGSSPEPSSGPPAIPPREDGADPGPPAQAAAASRTRPERRDAAGGEGIDGGVPVPCPDSGQADLREVKCMRTYPGIAHIVEACVRGNTILKMPGVDGGLAVSQVDVIMHTCRLVINERGGKACVLAPTKPRVEEYFEVAVRFAEQAKYIIADAAVEAWEKRKWAQVVEKHDFLLMGPNLFNQVLEK